MRSYLKWCGIRTGHIEYIPDSELNEAGELALWYNGIDSGKGSRGRRSFEICLIKGRCHRASTT